VITIYMTVIVYKNGSLERRFSDSKHQYAGCKGQLKNRRSIENIELWEVRPGLLDFKRIEHTECGEK